MKYTHTHTRPAALMTHDVSMKYLVPSAISCFASPNGKNQLDQLVVDTLEQVNRAS